MTNLPFGSLMATEKPFQELRSPSASRPTLPMYPEGGQAGASGGA